MLHPLDFVIFQNGILLSCHFKKVQFYLNIFLWFGITACCGSGGGLIAYAEANASSDAYNTVSPAQDIKKKKVVVLGTGWAGTSFLKSLNNPTYDVQVISPRNYFAFTPLLPSVTVGTVEARSIVEPVRNIVRKVTY